MANDLGATGTTDENYLRRERETLEVTLKCIGDAVIVTDVNGRVTFLNWVAHRGCKKSALREDLPYRQ
jgi:PAS domain-containing protein